MRSEFTAVGAGFDKLPGTLTPNKAVVVNAGGTGMTVTTGALALAGDFTTTGVFNTTLIQQANVSLTLPAATDTLVGRATTDTLTNKSISGSSNTLTNIPNGALTNAAVTIGSTSVALGATVTTFAGVTLTAPVFTTPALGTPASGVLTNCTGLPLASITGLGTGIATFLATPTSANLAAAVTNETGSGALVFGTNPTISGANLTGSPTLTLPTVLSGMSVFGTMTGATIIATSIGIGMTPINIFDITQDQNGASFGSIRNPNTGSGASAAILASNNTHSTLLRHFGTSFTTSGQNRQDGGTVSTDGAGGLTLSTSTDSLYMWVGSQRVFTSNATDMQLTTTTSVQVIVGGSGGVQVTSGASAWSAVSDYRAKNVAGVFANSGAIIDAVPVHLAALKATPENVKAMFLAHEVQAAIPYAVHGAKDGEAMQTVETTDPLVPIVWAELRALRIRVAAMEAH